MRTTVSIVAVVVSLAGVAHGGVIKEDYSARTIFGYNTQGVYRAQQAFVSGGQNRVTYLNPAKAAEINNTSGQFFYDKLSSWATGTGWSFASSINTLSTDSLKIHTYAAQGTAARVGAEFDVEYVPSTAAGSTDPTSNVHWIQVVRDNYNVTNNAGYGNFEWVVDNPFSAGNRAPYYDDGGAANSRNFYDYPGRTANTDKNIWWEAELFLCTGPAAGSPGLVTLYRTGISWGWSTIPTPGVVPTLALAGIAACRRRR